MNLENTVGKYFQREYKITEGHTARTLGSGDIDVLATPSMVLFMEETAKLLIQDFLPSDYISVGIRICVDHKKAVLPGETITATAQITKVEGKKIFLSVNVRYQGFIVGEGEHVRYVVNKKSFEEKVKSVR